MGPCSQHRQVFAGHEAGYGRGDRIELAADSRRRIWLHVERVVV